MIVDPIAFVLMIVAFLWIMGGYIITGFVENHNQEELSNKKTITFYCIWPFMPLKTGIITLIDKYS